MEKYSKSNQNPRQIHADHEGIKKILSKRSQHFALGTYVLCNNVRGLIDGMTKDGGSTLSVTWEDGRVTHIKNPYFGWKS